MSGPPFYKKRPSNLFLMKIRVIVSLTKNCPHSEKDQNDCARVNHPYIPNNNRARFMPIRRYSHSLSLPLRLGGPNVNTFYNTSGKILMG